MSQGSVRLIGTNKYGKNPCTQRQTRAPFGVEPNTLTNGTVSEMEIQFNPKPDFSQYQRSKVGIVQDESLPLIFNWIDTDYTVIEKPFP
ncbi:MAG: hypothetical protein EZS28_041730 [Streblomastix strix]|uniref:Uncharacterized protein n=1 Tax=Streblomastix strix TaxID=222440 RepID=A0A5J4TWS1_9EUKA|nr:MAG: hypothetical protein EZS28_041730 [Streblomastix strix]